MQKFRINVKSFSKQHTPDLSFKNSTQSYFNEISSFSTWSKQRTLYWKVFTSITYTFKRWNCLCLIFIKINKLYHPSSIHLVLLSLKETANSLMHALSISKCLSTFSSFNKTNLVTPILKVDHQREKENYEKLLFESRKWNKPSTYFLPLTHSTWQRKTLRMLRGWRTPNLKKQVKGQQKWMALPLPSRNWIPLAAGWMKPITDAGLWKMFHTALRENMVVSL